MRLIRLLLCLTLLLLPVVSFSEEEDPDTDIYHYLNESNICEKCGMNFTPDLHGTGTIVLPSDLTELKENVLRGIVAKSIVVPDSVTKIAQRVYDDKTIVSEGAAMECHGLRVVILPATMEKDVLEGKLSPTLCFANDINDPGYYPITFGFRMAPRE